MRRRVTSIAPLTRAAQEAHWAESLPEGRSWSTSQRGQTKESGLETADELFTSPCILDLVVKCGRCGRYRPVPPWSFRETARKHGSSRPPSRSGGARTVARAAMVEPVSARPGLHEQEGGALAA